MISLNNERDVLVYTIADLSSPLRVFAVCSLSLVCVCCVQSTSRMCVLYAVYVEATSNDYLLPFCGRCYRLWYTPPCKAVSL